MKLISGLRAGHWDDPEKKRGLTVFLFEEGARCLRLVLGGAPATRETDLLEEGKLIRKIDALLFTGGSAFGLGAAQGVMEYLEREGKGFETGVRKVPIVPAAAIFDLGVGEADFIPGPGEAYTACERASEAIELGRKGVGAGATVGKVLGMKYCSPGGFGAAEVLVDRYRVQIFIAVNALGNVVDPSSGEIVRGVVNPEGEGYLDAEALATGGKIKEAFPESNTTLALFVTDAPLSRGGLERVAVAVHDGIARCIRPSHTPFDGDIVFSCSLNENEVQDDYLIMRTSIVASRLTVEAVLKAVE